MSLPPVTVLGAGSIGVSFAILFACKGFDVTVYDPFDEALPRAAADLRERLKQLADFGDTDPVDAEARVRFTTDLDAALAEAEFVQECAPERVDLKQELLQRAATRTPPGVPLASSSSAIVPSRLAEGLDAAVAERILVGHPGNPPYLLPVVEVVPSPVDRGSHHAAGDRCLPRRRTAASAGAQGGRGIPVQPPARGAAA